MLKFFKFLDLAFLILDKSKVKIKSLEKNKSNKILKRLD